MSDLMRFGGSLTTTDVDLLRQRGEIGAKLVALLAQELVRDGELPEGLELTFAAQIDVEATFTTPDGQKVTANRTGPLDGTIAVMPPALEGD